MLEKLLAALSGSRRRRSEALGGLLMSAQRYAEAETPPARGGPAEPEVGEGELPARLAAGAHGKEGGGRSAARARQVAARGRRGHVAPAAATAGSGPMTCRARLVVACAACSSPLAAARSTAAARTAAQTKPPPSDRSAARGGRRAHPDDPKRARRARPGLLGPERLPAGARRLSARREGRARSAEAHNWLGVALSEKADLPARSPRCGRRSRSTRSTGGPTRTSAPRWSQSGDFAEAVEVFQKALALEPNSLGRPHEPGHGAAREGRPRRRAGAPAARRRGRSRRTPASNTSSARRCARAAISPAPSPRSRRRSTIDPELREALLRARARR